MSKRLAKKVLLIGWDAADWKVITPLLDAGLLPTLQMFVDSGVMGNIATLQPILSPMLWNSIATGKRADKHGILGFTEPDPQSGGIRASASTSRKVKALWNILSQSGLRSNVVGWFASHPAEPIQGVCVSEQYHRALAMPDEPWPLPKGAVHPERLAATLAELRLHPGELEAGHLLPFVPQAAKIDQEKDPRLAIAAKMLAECSSIHSAATWIMEHEPWDFMAVYYDGIDHFCHGFMHYHPPRQEHIPEADYELYKDVVSGIYRYHDMLLERLLQLAGPDTTVLLCSDHGFHSDHLRPKFTAKDPSGPISWHREMGVICLRGPHIKRDERIYGASLLDIAPTVLALFGLPLGDDMDGRPLYQAFEQPLEVERIPSWEAVDGESGMHPADRREDPFEAQAALEQLVALGYIEAPGEDQAKAVAMTVRESKFNLARVHIDAGRAGQAAELLEAIVAECPEEVRFLLPLAQCRYELGDLAASRRIIEGILARKEYAPRADLLLGSLCLAEGREDAALESLLRAEQANPRLPQLHFKIGAVYLRMRRWKDAQRSFRRAPAIDEDSPHAHDGMSAALLGLGRAAEAAEAALTAVGLMHHFPIAHFHLGALARLGYVDRAIQALETSLSMRPSLHAHRLLAEIHAKATGNLEQAAAHRRLAAQFTATKTAESPGDSDGVPEGL